MVHIDFDKCHVPNPAANEFLLDSLSNHVAVLCEHLFLSSKPPRPAESRWTGVPSVCRWCLAFSCFHQLLGPLLKALAAGAKDSGDAETQAATLDNDARRSTRSDWTGHVLGSGASLVSLMIGLGSNVRL